jgi:hypothetical protein
MNAADWTIFGCSVTEKTTVEEVEAERAEQKRKLDEFHRRHGRDPEEVRAEWARATGLKDPWEALKRKMRPGDELYKFTSPRETWANLAGRAGIALVRQGEVIATMITRMS